MYSCIVCCRVLLLLLVRGKAFLCRENGSRSDLLGSFYLVVSSVWTTAGFAKGAHRSWRWSKICRVRQSKSQRNKKRRQKRLSATLDTLAERACVPAWTWPPKWHWRVGLAKDPRPRPWPMPRHEPSGRLPPRMVVVAETMPRLPPRRSWYYQHEYCRRVLAWRRALWRWVHGTPRLAPLTYRKSAVSQKRRRRSMPITVVSKGHKNRPSKPTWIQIRTHGHACMHTHTHARTCMDMAW